MVIRRAAVVRVAHAPEPPLTEEQVRVAGPFARLFAARPWLLDALAALGVLVVGLFGAMFAWEAAVGAMMLGLYPSGPGVPRDVITTWLLGSAACTALALGCRRRPLTVTALMVGVGLVSLIAAGVLGVTGFALACAMAGVAARYDTPTTWLVLVLVLVTLTLAMWDWQDLGIVEITSWSGVGPGPFDSGRELPQPPFSAVRRVTSVVLLLALLLFGLAVGTTARARRLHAADLVERYRALARERDDSVALARAAERAHIAREMHDVVAHSLTVMVALADGADAAFDRAPDSARDALRQLASTGRSALTDMQRVLGALGPAEGAAVGRTQEPTEVDLPTLVARFTAAGVPVTATGLDTPLPDDTSLRLAVLRIVGEALTNVLRHAPGAAARLAVRRTAAGLEVEVVDTGGTRPGRGGGTGRGVVGMRERADLLGGRVEAGPHAEGGWRVHAVLPWEREDDDAADRADVAGQDEEDV